MRLIDADALIKKMEDFKDNDWNKNICTMLPNIVNECIDFVEDMPTAYDSDKVVEQLEERKQEEGTVTLTKIAYNTAIEDAIEIVKSGGSNE